MLHALLLTVSLTAAAAAAANPCPNGSFEQLTPGGFPADWAAVGTKVAVSADAHTGRHSLRLVRAAGTAPEVETGLNGPWRTVGGKPVLIDRLKGGLDFWYKAVSADGANLQVYVIPMNAEPMERTRSPRARYTVPKEHVGDGQWHRARLKYDFSKDPAARWALFASRIEGQAGELLLDDLAYVEQTGPILRLGTPRIEEDAKRPGERCTISVKLENAGDAPAADVRANLQAPAGLAAASAELRLGSLVPDAFAQGKWVVDGKRVKTCRLHFTATAGSEKATTSLELAPQLIVRSFGPVSPVSLVGEPIAVECQLANTGTVAVTNAAVTFVVGRTETEAVAKRIAPGRSETLSVSSTARQELDVPIRGVVRADNTTPDRREVESSVFVAHAPALPPPAEKVQAVATRDYAIVENENLRLAFRGRRWGFGAGEVSVKTYSGWRRVAWLRPLTRIVELDQRGARRQGDPQPTAAPQAAIQADGSARLLFTMSVAPSQGGAVSAAASPQAAHRLTVTFGVRPASRSVSCRYQFTAGQPCKLVAFDGPMLYALERDEAVFPGLEWLVDDEVSSGTLEIAENHPDRVRCVVHPNYITIPAIGVHGRYGTVGLLWDVHQKWDGSRDRPSAVFASPDHFNNQRAHLMGLFLPTVPEFVEVNKREATRPFLLEAGGSVSLDCRIYADGAAADALAAVDEWARQFGIPQPPPPPRGSYEKEVEFSMRAYLKSLWVPETHEWWTSKGGGMMSQKGRPPDFVADLLLGGVLSPGAEVRRQCRARAEEVLKLMGRPPRIDAQRFPGRFDHLVAHPGAAAGLLAARGEDGAWRFDADQVGTGPFVGLDYHDLGPDNAAELGTCARKAFEVLKYARITGDREAWRQMQKTLEFMERFRVPRAAQVWEVPVHAPDILAAADAVDAYIEAYRYSGDARWLRHAVFWARRGLPFVYLWSDPEKPFLLGGSIPVFGATWMQGSWFGRPVQWNGLRYAEAILKLAEHDRSYPWRQIAALVVHSALEQQDTSGENVALWPDNVGAVKGDKCPWVFAPGLILRPMLKLMGRDEEPATVIVGQGERRLHVTAAAKIEDVAWDGRTCSFCVSYPRGEQGVVLVCNVARPKEVLLSGKPVGEREDVEKGTEAGWRYDQGNACLAIRVPRDGQSSIRIEGAAWRYVDRLPRLADHIAFEFADSLDGWMAAHRVADLRIASGALTGRITGGDPYLIRMAMRFRGDACPAIRLRMRVTAGQGGEFYWTTEASPAFAPDKRIGFPLVADGQWHEYRLEPGKHPLWTGQTVTAIRIDPGNGAAQGELAIDYVRTELR